MFPDCTYCKLPASTFVVSGILVLPLGWLIDAQHVKSLFNHFHLNIVRFKLAIQGPEGAGDCVWGEFAYCDISQISFEVVPSHIEGAILRILLVVELIP